jgi:hypothetical protein
MTRSQSLLTFVVLLACAGSAGAMGVRPFLPSTHKAPTLPSELLYVEGGQIGSKQGYISVFDAASASPSPSPLYTILPAHGALGDPAVDGANNLYLLHSFSTGNVRLELYPSAQTVPTLSCRLVGFSPLNTAVVQNTLYIATNNGSIVEYALPFAPPACPTPSRTLVDRRALKSGFFAVTADAAGDVFGSWFGLKAAQVDVFPKGMKDPIHYATLGNFPDSFYMAADSQGNIIVNVGSIDEKIFDWIGVIPYGAKHAMRYDRISNGQYLGIAFNKAETEAFVMNDDISAVEVFSYDSQHAQLGGVLRSLSVWPYAQSIAVYSH